VLTRRHTRATVHPIKAMAVATIAVVGLAVLFNSDVPVAERLTRYEEGDSAVAGSVEMRGALNERVVNQFDELLLVGNGLDIKAQDDLRGSESGIHNMYVKTLYEAGFIAALALLAMLVVVLQQAWKLMINMRDTDVHLDVVAVFGSAVTGMTFALFQPMTVQRYFWMPFAVIQCFWVVRRAELRAQTRMAAGHGAGGRPATPRSSATRIER
jgi:O-antigen ligase